MKRMQIGQIVDYCIDYNERNKAAEAEAETDKKKTSTRYRLATQEEIDAYFG